MIPIMEISQAQRDVRTTFIGGFAGQLVTSAIWFLSAASLTWWSFRAGVLVLVVGGFFIFPLTQMLLRLMGKPASLPRHHPMNGLAIQIAFTLPLILPLVIAATLYRHSWFYPAFMIAVGSHYLPFIFLYGMWQFGVLAALLIGSGLVLGLYVPAAPSFGGWLTASLLLIFALIGRGAALSTPRH